MLVMKASPAIRAVSRNALSQARRVYKGSIRGLNKGATKSRNDASRIVRQTLNLKASYVKSKMSVIKATAGHERAAVRTFKEGVPLIKFIGLKQTSKGVSVRMRKDKPRKVFKSAFKARMPNQHLGAFRRKGKARLPIKELRGPTVYSIFAEKMPEIISVSEKYLFATIAREIEYELKRRF